MSTDSASPHRPGIVLVPGNKIDAHSGGLHKGARTPTIANIFSNQYDVKIGMK
jgi:hypothetical protein